MAWNRKQLLRFNRATHRDLGYFSSALLIVYCLSGIALNHVDAWNPDFIIQKREIDLPASLVGAEVTPENVLALSGLVGEPSYRVFDSPTEDQVKIYFADASLHVHLLEGTGAYEQISRRPLFYQVNVIHRNSFKPWRWGSDLFAIILILIAGTGLFVLKGKNGLGQRGKWWVAAGALPPLVVLLLHG